MGYPALKSLVQHLGIHAGLELSVIGILDQIIPHTALSVIVGIVLVESCQAIWRKTKMEKGANQ